MKVAIVGAGALGSLVGGLLSQSHNVTLVGRAAHIEAIRDRALKISGKKEGTFRPAATTGPVDYRDFDFVLVTVKAYDTRATVHDITRRIDPRITVASLQNGLTNEGIFLDAFQERAVMGTTSMGATLLEPGRVMCAGMGETVFGSPTGATSNAELVSNAFEDAGLPSRVSSDIEAELWMKGAISAGLNPVTAIAGCRNGRIAEDPDLRPVAMAACREAATVAQAEGINLTSDPTQRMLEVARGTASNTSSMLADLQNGRRTEIDEINGEIVRRGLDHGLDVSINSTLLRLVRAISECADQRP
jgi:2-dehydropantoate 2-reductase